MNLLLATVVALTLPKYWSVHIDTPRRDARAAFEQVDVDTAVAVRDFYAASGAERPPSWIFSTADGVYYSLRGRTSLTDFDNHPAPKGLGEKTAPISGRAHATLATHHNEIWQTDNDFTRLTDGAAPKYARLRVDRVAPPDEEKYEAAMKELCDECAKRGIRVVAFFSAYGDGAYRYLFLSDQPISVRKTGLAQTRDVDARARPDLTLTEPASWIR
jgi:hypothetical protein